MRKAAEAFAASDPELACLQAKLAIDRKTQDFFERQFALEYAGLFDALLPFLSQLKLSFPLGGTSNHFRTRLLREVGGWDPFNVTEDADLGLRLARRGLRMAMLDSTTWEEAPNTWRVWQQQRTRWHKGWMQVRRK